MRPLFALLAALPLAACAPQPPAPSPPPALQPAAASAAQPPPAEPEAPPAPAASAPEPPAAGAAPAASALPTLLAPRWTLPVPAGIEAFGFTADGASLVVQMGQVARVIEVATQKTLAERKAPMLKGIDAGRARMAEVTEHQGKRRLVVRSIADGQVLAWYDGSRGGLESIPSVEFSADGRRLSFEADRDDCAPQVWGVDDRKQIPFSTDFQTAAPVCHGELTASGNFVYFLARASGAFQDVRAKKVGPSYGRAVLSPRDTFVIAFPDRNWVVDETSPTRLMTAKNGRTVYSLANDTTQAAFSFNERLLATTSPRSIEIRTTSESKVLASVAQKDATEMAFSPRGGHLAVRTGQRLSLFTLMACQGDACVASASGDADATSR